MVSSIRSTVLDDGVKCNYVFVFGNGFLRGLAYTAVYEEPKTGRSRLICSQGRGPGTRVLRFGTRMSLVQAVAYDVS